MDTYAQMTTPLIPVMALTGTQQVKTPLQQRIASTNGHLLQLVGGTEPGKAQIVQMACPYLAQ